MVCKSKALGETCAVEGMVMDTSELHLSKAPLPIAVTDEGMLMDMSEEQYAKAHWRIVGSCLSAAQDPRRASGRSRCTRLLAVAAALMAAVSTAERESGLLESFFQGQRGNRVLIRSSSSMLTAYFADKGTTLRQGAAHRSSARRQELWVLGG